MPADNHQWQSNNNHWNRHNNRPLSKRAKAGIGGGVLAGIITIGVAAGSSAEGVALADTSTTRDSVAHQADAQQSAVDQRAAAEKKADEEKAKAKERAAAAKKAATERKAEAARKEAAAEKKAAAEKAAAKKKADAKRKAELAKTQLLVHEWDIFAEPGTTEASSVDDADVETNTWVKDTPHSWWKDTYATPKLMKIGTPDHGTAKLKGDTVVYTPNAGFLGDDTFTYTVKWKGHTKTGTVVAHVDKPYDYSGSDSGSSSSDGGGHVCVGGKHFKACT